MPVLQGITVVAAEAASAAGRAPTRLALALKAGRRQMRIAVYHLSPGGGVGVPLGATARLLAQTDVASSLPVQVLLFVELESDRKRKFQLGAQLQRCWR